MTYYDRYSYKNREAKRQGERDAEWGYDRHRHDYDPYSERGYAYRDGYESERRIIENREEERRQEEAAEQRRIDQRRHEEMEYQRQMEDEYWERQEQEEQPYPEQEQEDDQIHP
jgi:hypothetical protein